MSGPVELYQEKLWCAWAGLRAPMLEEIPPNKAQLHARISEDPFDGGRTAAWLRGLGSHATWRAVRDRHTGHTIHCVSNRRHGELTADLVMGLRLLAWMSRRPVVWFWWDQPWERVLPPNVDPGRFHINGGWAIPGIPEVHVYRREEAHKVLLHEAVHALGLDVPFAATVPVRQALEAELGRRLWPHLGEAYTELFAEWLWAIAGAGSLTEARARWAAQLECAEGQAAAVWARIRDATVDEDTNVFAYYILKVVLMAHLEEALLAPRHAVPKWIQWWRAARPALDALGAAAAETESTVLPMGMTCQR